MVATVEYESAAEDSEIVMVVASRETSASRKRFHITIERAEEVVVNTVALVEASVVAAISEADEVVIKASLATSRVIPTETITTKADLKDTTTKAVLKT